jgi:hypothetical protein
MKFKAILGLLLLSFFPVFASAQIIDLNKYDIIISDTLISKSDFLEKYNLLDSIQLKRFHFRPTSDGYKKVYYLNGKLYSEGNVKSGKENGFWVYWHENGQKAREGHFLDGKREGIHKYWFLNGRLRGEGGFKNDKYDGKWVMHKEDGSEMVEQVYKNGELVR